MADVLSQNQIDDLLRSFSTDGDKVIEEIESQKNEKKTKAYDFRMPKKFTKERLRVIDRIFENYARLLSSYFTGMLRLYCKVNVLQLEEQRYSEFSNALPEYVLMAILDLETNDEDIDDTVMIMQLSNPISFTLMDRLLGGNGSYVDINRDFTEIEIGLLRTIVEKLCSMQKEAWSSFIDINTSIASVETNARVIQSIAPDEIIIQIMLEVEIKDVKNTISICIPAMNLEQIMAKFNDKSLRSSRRLDPLKETERKTEILQGIKDVQLDVTAVLCETQVDLQDILHLQINDIIPLNTNINNNVIVKVGETTWFDGKLGAKNNRKAVRLDNTFKN